MKFTRIILTIILAIFLIPIFSVQTSAVLPPDIIVAAGSQLIQIFAVTFAVIGSIFTSMYQIIKTLFLANKKVNSKLVIVVALIIIAIVSLLIAYFIDIQIN
jgi:hypothetical protein